MRAPPHDARALPWSRTQDREIDDMTSSAPLSPQRREQQGMTWIPGGSFLMGSEDFYPEERPARRVEVEGFWMDECPGRGAGSRGFGKDPGCIPVAEPPLDPAASPDAAPDALVPGALVFRR